MNKITPGDNIGSRVLATLVDYGIYYGLVILLIFVFGEPNDEGGNSLKGLNGLVPIVFWLVYFPVAEGLGGQTLGHRLAGVQVVDEFGRSIGIFTSLKRRFFDWLDFSFLGLVAYLLVKKTDRHQRIGDMVAGTVVIGSEYAACQYCGESLTLTPKEALKRSFSCPTCKKSTYLDLDEPS